MTTDAGEELQTAGSQMESLTCCQRSRPEVGIQELSEVSPPTIAEYAGGKELEEMLGGPPQHSEQRNGEEGNQESPGLNP